MNTTEQQAVRERVAKDYAQAVTRPGGSCCGTGPDTPEQKGIAVKSAGYTSDELSSLPADAVVNSFGCGNPTAYTNVKEGDVVLDLGSGAGIDILLAARKVGPAGRAIGIDMTDEMIARAEENIAASGLTNVEVRKGIIEDMPVADASVDWVISNCVINLSPDKPAVFREIARVLKPGGRMLVSDIVVEEIPDSLREIEQLHSACVTGAISESNYVQGLREAGLEDVEVVDRFVYSEAQLAAMSELREELAEGSGACGCGGGEAKVAVAKELLERVVKDLAGKAWSATFSARKA